jgi:hypothetical protein
MGANLFAGAKGMTMSEQGVYFTPGFDGEVKILHCLIKRSRKSGDLYLVECVVTKSSSAEHPVGAKRTWIQGLKDADIGFRSVKSFCVAVLGLSPKKPEDEAKLKAFEEQCEEVMTASAQENAFKDSVVHLETTQKPTLAGKPFTLHVWTPAAA